MSFIKTGSYPDYLGFHGNRREEVDWRNKRALENMDSSRGENTNANNNVNVKGPNYNDYIYKCDICNELLRRELIYDHAEKHRIQHNRQAQFQFQNHQIPKENDEEEEEQEQHQEQQQQQQEVESPNPNTNPKPTMTEPWSQNSSIPNFNYDRWANSGYNYNYMSRLPPLIPNLVQSPIPVPVPVHVDYSSDPRIQRHYPYQHPQQPFIQEKSYPVARDRFLNEKRAEINSYSADQLIVISHWNRMNQLHQQQQQQQNNNNNNSQPLELPVNLNVTDSRQQLRQFLQGNKRRAGVIQIHRSQPSSKDLNVTSTSTSCVTSTSSGNGNGNRAAAPQSKRVKLSYEDKEVVQKQESVIKFISKFKENGKLEPKSRVKPKPKPKPKVESRKFKQDDESTPTSNSNNSYSNSDSDSDSEYSVSSLLAQNCLPPLPELGDFKPFSCHLCSDEFYSKLGINTHLAVHHRIRV